MSSVSDYRLVILGSGSVGKSCLTLGFISGGFEEKYDPTIEESYRKQTQVDGRTVLLDILDTAGQEEFSAMRDTYMRTGQGFVLVFSITDPSSVTDCIDIHDQLLRNQDSNDVPVILVGNKCDLAKERAVSRAEGEALAARFGQYCRYIEASAKSHINVTEIFTDIVRLIEEQRNPSEAKSMDSEKIEQQAGKSSRKGSDAAGKKKRKMSMSKNLSKTKCSIM